MQKTVLSIALLLSCVIASAGEVQFPTTQADIVRGLSSQPTGQSRSFGQNRSFMSRGVGGVVEDPTPAKVAANIQFAYNSAQILDESKALLNEFGKAFSEELAEASIEVVGHTDDRGNDDYNQELGQQRAQAVVDYLVALYGVERSRLKVSSRGEQSPIAGNDDEAGRAKNRRVEFIRQAD